MCEFVLASLHIASHRFEILTPFAENGSVNGNRKTHERMSKCLKGCLIFYGKCYVIIFYEVDLCLFCV